ncbi:MAG: hypothetical protein J7K26_03855 [Candidatus Aenigmarchaeota archaeon]|nr:hypothetical protein [Candidatus Aenigmarchaeota archaeon]
MPDFIPVLTAALIILLVLFIAVGGLPVSEEKETSPSSLTYYYPDISGTIMLGSNFTISNYADTKFLAKLDGRVSQGLISGEKKTISFKAQDYHNFDTGKIVVNIINTNLYGNLIVKINGKTVLNERPNIGKHEYYFDNNVLKTENTITVFTSGSGWRFWAPSIYDLNLSLYMETLDINKKSFKFDLDGKPERARIAIFGDRIKGEGEIVIKINDIKVYKGYLNAYKYFDPDILNIGENYVDIYSEQNSEYNIYSAKIILWDE